ncbi:MAG: hypothetical protein KAX25_01325 [Dehalococcoidia bacterium]|nr:hypothetical protein [Dehalococcoidia bacterium]MCK4580288.1 hypothetical protein [Dehalococcoidia bacterium]
MKVVLLVALALLVSIAAGAVACEEATPPVGGPCEYGHIPGVATVVSVEADDSEDALCQDAVVVTFDFVPDDASAVDDYRFPGWLDTGQHLTVGAGANPPRAWVVEQGLTERSEHRCVRSEITSGTCTPVLFSFPDIDFSDWSQWIRK